MTLTTNSNATATLSGRELALKRRQAMALHGKAAVAKASLTRQAAKPRVVLSSAPAAVQIAPAASGRSASRARREALSQSGKTALQAAVVRPGNPARPSANITAPTEHQAVAVNARPADTSMIDSSQAPMASAAPAANGVTRGAELAAALPTGRALAQARRAALAQDGKAGLKRVAQASRIVANQPQQDWKAVMAKGASGRQIAMQRRQAQSLSGRGNAGQEAARPSGRMRARNDMPAPAKVELGHTLSGRGVTGTMVERNSKVTGNEPGSCRAITGTEYIGREQFDTLCSTRPAPGPAKVGVGNTGRELKVTGTELGRSVHVTGDEVGACRGITGTEYLAAERFQEFCASRPAPSPTKTAVADTARGKKITGTLLNRPAGVTGGEQGAERAITGTSYSQPAAAGDAPEKVVQSHTSHGKTVTGTAVGHTSKITGDETGACRGITGTEYLAQEQFTQVCHTEMPVAPRKVSVMSSRADQAVSGSAVGRAAKVTGDEPGSCRNITGSQYYTPENFGALCDSTGPAKVARMQTLAGRTLTGSELGRSPKVTGDEMGGCLPVTGTEYMGADQQRAVCATNTPGFSPVAPVAKVAVDQTWRGKPVTGSYVGRSALVTGAEPGGCAPISGTPYIGRSQYNNFCESPALLAQEARIRNSAIIPSTAVTGDRPGAGGSVMTGDRRGACEAVSGTPYIGPDNMATQCATSNRFVTASRNSAWNEPERAPAPMDFSIVSPARAATERRSQEVTGGACNSERITGPINKASGLITGTPEFRHCDAVSPLADQDKVVAAARRLTGEGNQNGRPVTGDAWSAQSRVTGTEGASSLTRNPSARGNPRGMGVNAQVFRATVEHPAVPESRITGSSGSTSKGAIVTLSGGARG